MLKKRLSFQHVMTLSLLVSLAACGSAGKDGVGDHLTLAGQMRSHGDDAGAAAAYQEILRQIRMMHPRIWGLVKFRKA
ncbi:hypothetical protein ACKI1O_52630, partial [Streptomyces scabiei]